MPKKVSLYDRYGIAALCFGYFAAYIPYSMLTKMQTRGLLSGMEGNGVSGYIIQPVMVVASLIFMMTFITAKGWWKYATHSTVFGISFPRPQWFTLVSGVCTAGQIITTTLAYTFEGVSIVFAMLLMRGGVLIMAPIIDTIAVGRKRRIYWPSWVAAGLSLGALLAAFVGKASTAITIVCALDIALYLFVYFFRLYFMSNKAKSDDEDEKIRYFTEEQTVANPILLIVLFGIGLAGSRMDPQSMPGQVWLGFTEFPFTDIAWIAFITGLLSAATGLFGGLIYLDKRENTFTVPANRVSSILAGVVATYMLGIFYGLPYPSVNQLVGVGLVVFAIVFLTYRNVVEKRHTTKASS